MQRLILILTIGISTASLAQQTGEFRSLQGNLFGSNEIVSAIHRDDREDPSGICVESYRCADSNARIARVVGQIDAPLERVWQVLTDYRDYGGLIPRCTRCVLVRPDIASVVGESNEIPSSLNIDDFMLEDSRPLATPFLYSEIDIVYPVGQVRSILEIRPDSSGRAIYWRKIASNIAVYEGAWLLIPSGEQTTVVCATRYRLNVWLPPFLIHSGVHHYFPQIIAALRDRVRQHP